MASINGGDAARRATRTLDAHMSSSPDFGRLIGLFERLPAISLPAGRKSFGYGVHGNDNWWLKFSLNLDHKLAWRHVQELGHVLNYLSLKERLPTVFMPVSPSPSLNGGAEFLSWVVESTSPTFTPDLCAEWLENRLPQPVDDLMAWEE